jgi:dolichol-phosphate mannosyltransferase
MNCSVVEKKEKVIIIIPTYNESLVIEDTIHQVFSVIHQIKRQRIEILVFDSASTDNTQEKVRALQKQYGNSLHLQTEKQKSGLGSAYMQAMRYAFQELHSDVIVEFDADLSHQPKYLIPLLDALSQYDVVIGSRYVRGGSIPKNWGIHRKFLSILGNYVARVVLTPQYKDFTSGFRATRRCVLEKVLPTEFLSNNYAYKLHLLWMLHKNKAKIGEIPIHFIDREKGLSKLPTNSIIDSLRVIFILRYREIKSWFRKIS